MPFLRRCEIRDPKGETLVGHASLADLFKPKGDCKVIITSSASNEQSWED
jgi:hypothetical protein